MMPPFSLQKWIEDHRELLRPPVGNKQIYHDSNFIIMAVGGPNSRTDFHVNQSDEFFYQLEGHIFLRIVEGKKFKDIPIQQGEIFLLHRGIPHSPQRSKGSLGIVIEKTRTEGEIDRLQWYCQQCVTQLYEESFFLTNIEKQFAAVFERYYNSTYTLCPSCQYQNGREWKK